MGSDQPTFWERAIRVGDRWNWSNARPVRRQIRERDIMPDWVRAPTSRAIRPPARKAPQHIIGTAALGRPPHLNCLSETPVSAYGIVRLKNVGIAALGTPPIQPPPD
jgi:hypothetical protein